MAPAPAVIAAMALAMSPAMNLLDADRESGEQDGNAASGCFPVLHSGLG